MNLVTSRKINTRLARPIDSVIKRSKTYFVKEQNTSSFLTQLSQIDPRHTASKKCVLNFPFLLATQFRRYDHSITYPSHIVRLYNQHLSVVFCCAGFINLSLPDQMNLLQCTWLDVLNLNLAYRSSPYKGVLAFADDFHLTEEDSDNYQVRTVISIRMR